MCVYQCVSFLRENFCLLKVVCLLLTGLETFLIHVNTRRVSAELTATQENLMLVGQITAGGKTWLTGGKPNNKNHSAGINLVAFCAMRSEMGFLLFPIGMVSLLAL